MSEGGLWLSFLDRDDGNPAPRLRLGPGPDAEEVSLTDRARWVIGAIALPRELAPPDASDERHRSRLGSRLWSSGEITSRIPYQHRSTIRLALADLRERLGEHDLTLEDFLVIDTDRGRYGIRSDRLTVDVIELHARLGDLEAFGRELDLAVGDRRRAQLAPVCAHLVAEPVLRELEIAIGAATLRGPEPPPAPVLTPDTVPVETPEPAPGADPSPPRDITPELAALEAAVAAASAQKRDSNPVWPIPGRRRRRSLLARGFGALVIVAIVAALVPVIADGHHHRIHALGPARVEVSGGVAHTWSDPEEASGKAGPEIMALQRVLIACRVKGFKVPDGNVWWYLIAQKPWSERFYVTADTFYNNGHTSGSLRGSAFVDPHVSHCS